MPMCRGLSFAIPHENVRVEGASLLSLCPTQSQILSLGDHSLRSQGNPKHARVLVRVCICLQVSSTASGKDRSSWTRRTAPCANASTSTAGLGAPRPNSLFHVAGNGTPRSAALSALTWTSDSWIAPSTAMAQWKARVLCHANTPPWSPIYLARASTNCYVCELSQMTVGGN